MLEARNITINFEERTAVADVSLCAEPGQVIAIIGPNGAGKSTRLRALKGTVKPSRGAILLDDRPIDSFARRAVARRVAVVAQEAELRFPISVMEFVLGGRYAWSSMWGWENEDDVEIARGILKKTELEGFEARLMNELSGGERQRVVLARALATQAQILLLDEPTANLDLAHQATMLRLIRNHCDTARVAAVIVTHDLNLAAEFADLALLMQQGRAVTAGPPREIFTPALLERIFTLRVLVDAHPISGAPRITPIHEKHG